MRVQCTRTQTCTAWGGQKGGGSPPGRLFPALPRRPSAYLYISLRTRHILRATIHAAPTLSPTTLYYDLGSALLDS